MTARAGLSDLIQQLRGMTNAGTADYSVGTASFWDGDQMQVILDRHRIDVYQELLEVHPERKGGGTIHFKEYRSQYRNFEQTTGGTAIFVVEDVTGADSGTANWSADYARGIVTFAANQGGTAYLLTGRAYDLNAAAADVWRMKASAFAEQFDFSTDNHSVSRSQKIKNALEMAQYYEGLSGVNGANTVTMYRSDVPSDYVRPSNRYPQ